MSKIGRNEPCPCGSGKKYKHCHGNSNTIVIQNAQDIFDSNNFQAYTNEVENWNRSEDPPTFMEFLGKPNLATESFSQMREMLGDKKFSSIEEARSFMEEYVSQYQSSAMEDFLGLSPEQMHVILNHPFDENKNILELQVGLKQDDINTIPVMRQAICFLEKVQEAQPLKATAAGKLPTKLVKDLYQSVFQGYDIYNCKVNKEDDYPQISALKHLLTFSGLLKKYNGAFSLTKSGNKLIEAKDFDKLYRLLFLTYIEKYHWGFLDGYKEFAIIQRAAIFDLYLLKCKAMEFQEDKLLGGYFLKAYPQVLQEAEDTFVPAEDYITACFALRFLDRFCLSFGLVEKKQEGDDYLTRKCFYKTSDLFKRLFVWRI